MRKTVNFTDRACEIVEFFQKEEGHSTFTATLHSMIQEIYHRKYYSKYGNRSQGIDTDPATPDPSPLELAYAYEKNFKGKVSKDEMELAVPLTAGTAHLKLPETSQKLLTSINHWRRQAAMQPLTIEEILEGE